MRERCAALLPIANRRHRQVANLRYVSDWMAFRISAIWVRQPVNTQTLLFADPRPLVERLGRDFFRQLPQGPGVYLMRDSVDAVLYVGKAKNLRKRLCSYRVANPDRMPRRHLKLLRAVARIDLQECVDERAALARESELLRTLRPRYNRAGIWPGRPRFLLWRTSLDSVELAVAEAVESGWGSAGPLGGGAEIIRAALLRLLWCAMNRDLCIAAMPHAWFRGRHSGVTVIPLAERERASAGDCIGEKLEALFRGETGLFAEWVQERTESRTHAFEVAVRDADLETLVRLWKSSPPPEVLRENQG